MNEDKILELKLKRMDLLSEYDFDRSNPTLVKLEREILKEIERLSKEK